MVFSASVLSAYREMLYVARDRADTLGHAAPPGGREVFVHSRGLRDTPGVHMRVAGVAKMAKTKAKMNIGRKHARTRMNVTLSKAVALSDGKVKP